MARTSRIPHPVGSRYVQIHAWAVKAVGRDAAAVLAEIEFRDRCQEHADRPVATRVDLIAALQGLIGRNAIDAALEHLAKIGWITRSKLTRPNARGRNITTIYQYTLNVEAIATYLATPGFPVSGPIPVPVSGNPTEQVNLDLPAAACSVAAPPVSGHAAACSSKPANTPVPQPHIDKRVKRRRVRPSGIITWTPDDEAEAERLEASRFPAKIEAAVITLKAAGKQPVPGLVAREIDRQMAREQAETRHATELAQNAAHVQAMCRGNELTSRERTERRALLYAAVHAAPPPDATLPRGRSPTE
ncbi:MAG: hypothetical protein Q8O33_17335 [Pseudomonadota bacterium]|nr:hypothetical protein [Pseudomonadota bacterium]